MVAIKIKVRKVGSSLVVTLPEEVISESKIKAGDILAVDLNNDNYILMRLVQK